MNRVLLVDDDPQGLESARKILEFGGFEVIAASDGQIALEKIRSQSFDVVVTDVRMPNLGGLEFLRALSVMGETTPVILMTAFGRVEDAVWAMKLGAVDFLSKPFKRQTLMTAIDSALKRSRAAAASKPASAGPVNLERINGSSSVMRELRAQITQIAPTKATVLIQGESGTGKELIARAIHEQSSRAKTGRMIALNCAAVPEQLIESELFGVEKGAFTGASVSKEGLFAAADQGTLLLDEIGDMPLSLQAKLLRVLQEGEVRRVGATASRKVDVRVIAATHRDLRESVKQGTFRQDLLFRLEVISLRVPALRERSGDLPELCARFLAEASERHGKKIESIAPDAMEALLAHSWPGNVRELSNVIERAVVFAEGPSVLASHLPAHLLAPSVSAVGSVSSGTFEVKIGTPLREVEDLLIRRTLEATDGDKNITAKLLGINSRTIYRKLGEKGDKKDDAANSEPQDAST